MKDIYKQWVVANVSGNGYGTCALVTRKMEKAFPELKRVRGHVLYWNDLEDRDKKTTHWWMVDAQGEIVDPTAQQFAHLFDPRYEEWDESSPEPTGKCPNCGEYCYSNDYVCSKKCEREFDAYMNSPGL